MQQPLLSEADQILLNNNPAVRQVYYHLLNSYRDEGIAQRYLKVIHKPEGDSKRQAGKKRTGANPPRAVARKILDAMEPDRWYTNQDLIALTGLVRPVVNFQLHSLSKDLPSRKALLKRKPNPDTFKNGPRFLFKKV